jgi:lipid II:glycine glycyltransferase (peptidoglycan interpeptide bridge formation enzyme)
MSLRVDYIVEPRKWNEFIVTYAPQSLFQSWLWGEVQRKIGNTVARFGFYEGGTLMGVAQTVLVSARRGTFLHVRHGPVLADDTLALWRFVLAHLSSEAKIQRCLFVRMSPLIAENDKTKELFQTLHTVPSAIHRMDGEYCWVLDLSPSEEALLAGMRKSTRYEIRKGQKDGVRVFATSDPKRLTAFFDLYKATSTRHGFVPHSGIREEFEVFAKENQATLYLGEYRGRVTAAAIVLYVAHQAIYHHGASVQSQTPVSPLVQWEAIREAKKRGMKVYNFWGIAPYDSPKHPWRGITLFKKGFGGREIRYMHAHDLPISPWYVIPRTIELVRRVSRGYD